MEKKLKAWQGWLLFGGTMVIVFVLGLIVASLMEHRAEVVSIYNNRKVDIKGIEARNEIFRDNYPREYQTWSETADTSFKSEFNGNQAVDVLEQRPEMVILWAGYVFQKNIKVREDICMRLKISEKLSEPEHLKRIKMVLSLQLAGHVKVRMFLV